MVLNRVTRLGECLPNGWLLTSGRYLKISEVSYLFELLYSIIKFKHEIGSKNGLGYILGDVFFTNSSGHPGFERPQRGIHIKALHASVQVTLPRTCQKHALCPISFLSTVTNSMKK
jgi:hypothetical protein